LPAIGIAGSNPASWHQLDTANTGRIAWGKLTTASGPVLNHKGDKLMAFKPNYGQQRQDRERAKLKKAQARLDRQDQKMLERKEQNSGQHDGSGAEGGDGKES
jgi:hypothetical protein